MSTKIGLQGELLASSVLQGYGIDNDLVGKEGYDLLAWLEQKPIRVQVKATKNHIDRGKNVARYNFQTNYGGQKTPISKIVQCDLLALVALEVNVLYILCG